MAARLTVAVAFRIDEDALARIRAVDPAIEVLDLSAISGRQVADDETKARYLKDIGEATILFGPNRIPIEYFDAAHNLHWFQCINAGVERLAHDGLLTRGFAVTTAAGLASVAIAEYVIGTMIMLAKGLHSSVLDQARRRWDFRFTGELAGKTVGIVGFGAIGREIARRAHAFDMRVIASRRRVQPGEQHEHAHEVVSYSDLDYLLAESDYLVLAVPLTPETRHLLGREQFAKMKPAATLVNIARGEVVDQPQLIEALQAGVIAAAALDVTDPEPLPAESTLWGMPNVILTPHISGAVEGYGHKAAELFLANLERFVRGEPLQNLVSPELGY